MANVKYANFARSKLAQSAAASDTQIFIENDVLFPTGDFTAVIWSAGAPSPLDDADSEIVTMTRSSEGIFDTVRAEEETSAKIWQKGANIANVVTADTMNQVLSAVGAAYVTEISADTYDMSRDDTNCAFSFSEDEIAKSVTLPETALCTGLKFILRNEGTSLKHQVKLYPYTGDIFADTENTFIRIPQGGMLNLTATDEGWRIIDINSDSYRALKVMDSADYTVSFTEGVIYADCSAGNIELSLPDSADAYGIPLTFIKYDSSGHYLLVDNFDGYPQRAVLNAQYESITFVIEPDGTKRLLDSTAPRQKTLATASENKYLAGHERYVFCEGGESGITVNLPFTDIAQGKTVTVKKIDSGAGAVKINPYTTTIDDDWHTVDLTTQWEYASFACDGEQWFRVG